MWGFGAHVNLLCLSCVVCGVFPPIPPGLLTHSARTKLELKLRRTRERVSADLKGMASDIESFKSKWEITMMNAYCEQLMRIKTAMEATDRWAALVCAPLVRAARESLVFV